MQAQYSELFGWLYQDAGEYQLAESWIDRAFGLSHMAGDQDLTVFLLTCKAHLASDMRVAVDTIGQVNMLCARPHHAADSRP